MIRMFRRSLTLLELMIAIVLLLAIAALIFPSMLRSMDERTFESAADVTNEQLMMARAHAQATGSPVEVTYHAGTSRVQARFFLPWLTEPSAEPSLPGGVESAVERAERLVHEPQRQGESESEIGEAWASRELGHGIRIVARRPHADLIPGLDASDDGESGGFEELGKGQDVRLAVFMPDGSALLGDPVWLNDQEGRCGVLTINPWSGLPVFERLTDPTDGRSSAEETEDQTTAESRDNQANDREWDRPSRSATKSDSKPRGGRQRPSPPPQDESPADDEPIGSD
jgi:hypothetical protein